MTNATADVRKQAVASAVGSIAATLILNPVGVVKTRVQATHGKFLDIVRGVMKESGVLGFWTGARLGIIQSMPSTVIYMTTYEKLKLAIGSSTSSSFAYLVPGISGGLARSVVVTVLAPLELMKTVQLGGGSTSFTELARDIYARQGIGGFYRGWGSTIMRDTPFSMLYWMCFENMREKVYGPMMTITPGEHTPGHVQDSYSPLVNFLSGATSGMLAAIATHPFDVLKTRLQVSSLNATISEVTESVINRSTTATTATTAATGSQRGALNVCCMMAECCCPCTGRVSLMAENEVSTGENNTSSTRTNTGNSSSNGSGNGSGNGNGSGVRRVTMRQGLMDIVRTRGVRGLYAGLAMRLATIVPGGGIMITVYEFAKTLDLNK